MSTINSLNPFIQGQSIPGSVPEYEVPDNLPDQRGQGREDNQSQYIIPFSRLMLDAPSRLTFSINGYNEDTSPLSEEEQAYKLRMYKIFRSTAWDNQLVKDPLEPTSYALRDNYMFVSDATYITEIKPDELDEPDTESHPV